jgi:hypothetical protein
MLATEGRGRVVVSVLSLALPVLLLWRCAAHPEPSPKAPADTRPSESAPSLAAPSLAAPSLAAPSSAATFQAPSAAPSAPLTAPMPAASSSTAAPIIAAVAHRDARDLALLSRIERELKRDPPAAVHALIRMREAGASRSQLIAESEKRLSGDVTLRVVVRRWIDEVTPDGSVSPKALGPAPSGTHAPLVKPIDRASSP